MKKFFTFTVFIFALASSLIPTGCGVVFRDFETSPTRPSVWCYRSVVQDNRTIFRCLQGKSFIHGFGSVQKSWDYYCIGIPTMTMIYLVDMPLCFVADTVLLPYDLWYALGRTPSLFELVRDQQYQELEARLRSGANPNAPEEAYGLLSPLHYAVIYLDETAVVLLLQSGATPTSDMLRKLQGLAQTSPHRRDSAERIMKALEAAMKEQNGD